MLKLGRITGSLPEPQLFHTAPDVHQWLTTSSHIMTQVRLWIYTVVFNGFIGHHKIKNCTLIITAYELDPLATKMYKFSQGVLTLFLVPFLPACAVYYLNVNFSSLFISSTATHTKSLERCEGFMMTSEQSFREKSMISNSTQRCCVPRSERTNSFGGCDLLTVSLLLYILQDLHK